MANQYASCTGGAFYLLTIDLCVYRKTVNAQVTIKNKITN